MYVDVSELSNYRCSENIVNTGDCKCCMGDHPYSSTRDAQVAVTFNNNLPLRRTEIISIFRRLHELQDKSAFGL